MSSSLQQFLNSMFPPTTNTIRQNLPTDTLAKAVLAMVLMKKFKTNISTSMDYEKYDGTILPTMSGYNLINAVTTYIDHGSSKSEAIEKFIDNNLRSEEQLTELLEYLSNSLE